MLKQLLFLLMLVFPVLAIQIWTYPTFGTIESAPVFFDNKLVVASYDGYLYCIYQQSGGLAWKTDVGIKINDLMIANGLIVGASDSAVIVLDKNGNIMRTINETVVYGIDASSDAIYVSTKEGVHAYGYDGNLRWTLQESSTPLTDILLLNDSIIFGAGRNLVVATLAGIEKHRIRVGNVWKSTPIYDNGTVYMGTNDGKFVAVDILKNKTIWEIETYGWIMSNPIYTRGIIYFASSDGNLYSVNAKNGTIIWSRKFSAAIQGGFQLGTVGGKEVLLAGSDENRVYFIDVKNGNVVVSFSARGAVHNPAFYSSTLFFGSYDGFIYAYIIDRGCNINSPANGESVGYAQVNITGKVYSQYMNPNVFVRVNNGSWQSSNVYGNDWSYNLDPNQYAFGPIFIECKTSDSDGEERTGFSYSLLYRSSTMHMLEMNVIAPSAVVEGAQFSINATKEDGSPLDSFVIQVDGRTYYGKNGTVSIKLTEVRKHAITVTKPGYSEKNITIGAVYDIVMIEAIVATIGFVGLAAFYFLRYKKK